MHGVHGGQRSFWRFLCARVITTPATTTPRLVCFVLYTYSRTVERWARCPTRDRGVWGRLPTTQNRSSSPHEALSRTNTNTSATVYDAGPHPPRDQRIAWTFFFSLSPCRRWARLKRPVIAWLQGGARKDLLPLDLSSFPPRENPFNLFKFTNFFVCVLLKTRRKYYYILRGGINTGRLCLPNEP